MKLSIAHLLLLAAGCATISMPRAQGVYVKQGPNGPVFSDQPLPGGREVKLKPLNVLPAPPVEVKLPTEAPVPESAPVAGLPPYDRFQILFPENDGSAVANAAVFEVRLALNPPLRLAEQHAFVISLNGRPVNQRFTATEFMVPPDFWPEPPPPDQAVQLDAMIIDGKGQVVKRAEPVRFHLRYATVYQNPDYPDGPVLRPRPMPHNPDRHRKPVRVPEDRSPTLEAPGNQPTNATKQLDR